MLPLLPAPQPTAGGVKQLLSLLQHCQIPKAEEGTLLDTCPFKTTAGLAVRENPLLCPALKIRLKRKAVGRFFFFVLTSQQQNTQNFSWDFNGILWIFHLTDTLHLQGLQFFLVSACNTSLFWSLSCNYRTLVCHKVTEKRFI